MLHHSAVCNEDISNVQASTAKLSVKITFIWLTSLHMLQMIRMQTFIMSGLLYPQCGFIILIRYLLNTHHYVQYNKSSMQSSKSMGCCVAYSWLYGTAVCVSRKLFHIWINTCIFGIWCYGKCLVSCCLPVVITEYMNIMDICVFNGRAPFNSIQFFFLPLGQITDIHSFILQRQYDFDLIAMQYHIWLRLEACEASRSESQ